MEKCIGVLSDTHGVLRKEVIEKLKLCDLIIHAGDVGNSAVLEDLRKISTVVAVKGNIDHGNAALKLQATEVTEYCGKHIFIIHNLEHMEIDPKAAGIDIVIFGHSHQSFIGRTDSVLYLNPGSAGPKRFQLPVSMAYIRIKGKEIFPEIIELKAQ